jgi:hypothetical protein
LSPLQCTGKQRNLRIQGPDDIELLIERYPSGYVWKILNGSLHAIAQSGLEIVITQSFDSKKLAFRERIASRIGWTSQETLCGRDYEGHDIG